MKWKSRFTFLCVRFGGGEHYYTEVQEVFTSEALAEQTASQLQGKIPKADARYFVVSADFNELEIQ